jgi:hypothetical protein
MGHDNYKKRVDSEFDERVEEEDTPAKLQMALWCTIAKNLFDAADEETQQRLHQENEDQHNALLATAENAGSRPAPKLSVEDQQA